MPRPARSLMFDFTKLRPTPSGYVLTTGMLSALMGVAPRTISKWFDAGRLKGFRVPGSDDRRVYAHVALKFMRDSKMEPPPGLVALLEGEAELVTVGLPDHAADVLKMFDKSAGGSHTLRRFETPFDLSPHVHDPNRFGVLVIGSEVCVADARIIIHRVHEKWVVVQCHYADVQPIVPGGGIEVVAVPEDNLNRLCAMVGHCLEHRVV